MKNEIIIKVSPRRQDNVFTIRREIRGTGFNAEDLTSVICPYLKEDIISVKIISKKEKNSEEEFFLEAGAFEGCWHLRKIILDIDCLVLNNHAFDGCSDIRRIRIKGW